MHGPLGLLIPFPIREGGVENLERWDVKETRLLGLYFSQELIFSCPNPC